MTKTHLALALLGAQLLGALPLAAQTPTTSGKQVNDFSFPSFFYGDGRQKLSDFFGQPIMIEEWGVH
jgi:hypothetical protein